MKPLTRAKAVQVKFWISDSFSVPWAANSTVLSGPIQVTLFLYTWLKLFGRIFWMNQSGSGMTIKWKSIFHSCRRPHQSECCIFRKIFLLDAFEKYVVLIDRAFLSLISGIAIGWFRIREPFWPFFKLHLGRLKAVAPENLQPLLDDLRSYTVHYIQSILINFDTKSGKKASMIMRIIQDNYVIKVNEDDCILYLLNIF